MQLVYKTRGHPRAKHLVYVVVAGSKRIPSRRETAKNHEKRHAIVFFGAVSSRSGHRSVGYHRPYGRRRYKTLTSGSGPWDVGQCVVRVSRRDAVSGKNRDVGREIWQGPSQPPRCGWAALLLGFNGPLGRHRDAGQPHNRVTQYCTNSLSKCSNRPYFAAASA